MAIGNRQRSERDQGDGLGVIEATLENGLRVIVLPLPALPVVVCDVFYRVGSVDDPSGATGLAHFVEHMLFKATKRLPRGQIDRLVFLAGGMANAETSEDDTHYWSVFPADRWEIALEIEAERMGRASFDPADVEAERRVIREERARDLELPASRLEQTHLCVSYLTHPYRNPILGWPEDVEEIGPQALEAFYGRHYQPESAVMVLSGPMEPGRAIRRVEARLGRLGSTGPRVRTIDPPAEVVQRGRRMFHLREPGELTRGLLGWHTVPRRHPDAAALDVLADVLACGRKSRLWDRIVERDQSAGWIDAWHDAARLAGVFQIQVEGLPRTRIDRLEASIFDEITRLMHLGPSEAELGRSQARLEAAWRWDRDDPIGLSSALGHAELYGHWSDYADEHHAALAVTATDVRRVAQKYLIDDGLTLGWLGARVRRRARTTHVLPPLVARIAAGPEELVASEPVTELSWAGHAAGGLALRLAKKMAGGPARCDEFLPRRVVLPSGLTMLSERRSGSGVVALELYCDAGCLRESKPGLANLTARLREEGTLTRSPDEIAEEVEDLGAQLEVHPTGLTLRCQTENLDEALELAADLTMRPAFPEESLTWVREKVQAELRAEREDPAFRASLAFQRLVYGDHAYGRDHRGSPREIARLGLEDILEHHQKFFAPDCGVLTVVGDYEPARLMRLVKRHLGSWEPRGRRLPRVPQPERSRVPRRRRIPASGEQVHLFLGHLGIPRNHRDYPALVILDHILGSGAGLTNHLGRILRDELGLAYAVSGGIAETSDVVPGSLRVYVGTGAEDVDRAVAAARGVLEALHRGEFCDDEVFEVQQHLGGSWVMDYLSITQRAERLLEIQRWDLPLDEPALWPERLLSVTPKAVRRAAKRHLYPESLIELQHGPVLPRRGGTARGRSVGIKPRT